MSHAVWSFWVLHYMKLYDGSAHELVRGDPSWPPLFMHTFRLPPFDHSLLFPFYIYFCCLLVFIPSHLFFVYKSTNFIFLTSVIITTVSDSEVRLFYIYLSVLTLMLPVLQFCMLTGSLTNQSCHQNCVWPWVLYVNRTQAYYVSYRKDFLCRQY